MCLDASSGCRVGCERCLDGDFLFIFNFIQFSIDDLCREQGIGPSNVRHRCFTLYRRAPLSMRIYPSPSGHVNVHIHVQHQH